MLALIINQLHGLTLTAENIEIWVKDMRTVFEVAENKNNQFYAILPIFKDFLFKDVNDVLKNKDSYLILKNHEAKGRENSFLNKDIHFIKDCIPMFYDAFKQRAVSAYEYVYNGKGSIDDKIIPAINLDTGRSLAFDDGNNLDKGVTFWGQV